MKYEITVNLFWAIVWAVVLICSIIGLFWKPAIYAVILESAIMLGMFLHDFVKVIRMK